MVAISPSIEELQIQQSDTLVVDAVEKPGAALAVPLPDEETSAASAGDHDTLLSSTLMGTSPSKASSSQDAATAVTQRYLKEEEVETPEASAVEAKHQQFCAQHVDKINENAMGQFGSWVSTFRDSPQVVSAVVQSYAAVLVARENRLARMHTSFCELLARQYNARTLWKSVRERCRAQTVQEFVRSRAETQKASLKAWTDVAKSRQEQLTKRVESMEITKRLVAHRGLTRSQAVFTVGASSFIATLSLFRAGAKRGVLQVTKRKVLLTAVAFYIYQNWERIVQWARGKIEKHGFSAVVAILEAAVTKAAAACFPGFAPAVTDKETVEASMEAVAEAVEEA